LKRNNLLLSNFRKEMIIKNSGEFRRFPKK
jgi:hypothetical protein